MKFTILLAIVLGASTLAIAQHNDLIGYRHKPTAPDEILPNGYKSLGEQEVSEPGAAISYGVGRYSSARGQMLWLEFVTGQDEMGATGMQVTDTLDFPDLRAGQDLFFGGDSPECTLDGKFNRRIVALAEVTKIRPDFRLVRTWLANLKSGKFEKIDVKRVKCEYKVHPILPML